MMCSTVGKLGSSPGLFRGSRSHGRIVICSSKTHMSSRVRAAPALGLSYGLPDVPVELLDALFERPLLAPGDEHEHEQRRPHQEIRRDVEALRAGAVVA